MSEATDVVLAQLKSYEKNDWATLERHFAPDAVVVGPPDWPETGERIGWAEIREQFERLKSDWSEEQIEAEELIEPRPGVVFARLRWTVTGAASGIPFAVPMWMVATIRDGKVVRAEYFQQETQARAVAGI